MEGGGELGIHYLKTWSREPLPPQRNRFRLQESSRSRNGKRGGRHESAGEREKSLWGVVKSRK